MSNPEEKNQDEILEGIEAGVGQAIEKAILDAAACACEGGSAGPNPYAEKPIAYEESNKTVVEVGLDALALLLGRTEALCKEEKTGSIAEEQIRRNVETIAQGYAALKYR